MSITFTDLRATIYCPHCQGEIHVELSTTALPPTEFPTDHSTTVNTASPTAIRNGEGYLPNPTRSYRTPAHLRRDRLAYYYEHREEILERAKERRRELKNALTQAPRS